MKLSEAYSKVVKYGKVPDGEIAKWLRVIDDYQANNNVKSNAHSDVSHPDYPFADFLQDNDDLRGLIVLKDLELRNSEGDTWNVKSHKNITKLTEDNQFDSEGIYFPHDEEINVHKLTGSSSRKSVYSVVWQPYLDNRKSQQIYVAHLTPEEYTEFETKAKQDNTVNPQQQ